MSKRKRGAPITVWTPERIDEVIRLMDDYTENTAVPILAEVAYQNHFSKPTLYDIPELSDPIKRLLTKKESQLEKGALAGQVNATMAIFSLKQMGWRDKQEVEMSEKRPVILNGKLMQIVDDAD